MIISITGFPGTETKKLCKTLALRLGLRHFSLEISDTIKQKEIQEIKEKINEEESKGNFITDSVIVEKQLQNCVKVFLNSSTRIRAKKTSEREKIPLASALEKIEFEKKNLEKTLKKGFGSDYFSLESIDLVLNIDKLNEEAIIALIEKFLERIQK